MTRDQQKSTASRAAKRLRDSVRVVRGTHEVKKLSNEGGLVQAKIRKENTVSDKPKNDPKLRSEIERGLAVVDKILAASEQQIRSRAFLLECLAEYGIPFQPWDLWSPWVNDYMNTTNFGAVQIPTEFVDFLLTLGRVELNSAAEIGVLYGGSTYFQAAVLQRLNPDIEYHLIDIQDNLMAFDEFSSRLNLKKNIPSTSYDFAGKEFDYVFIDGDHSYEGVMRDFVNLGRHSKVALACHDIHGHEYDKLGGGTVKSWARIKEHYFERRSIYEFSHSSVRWMGIGLALHAET